MCVVWYDCGCWVVDEVGLVVLFVVDLYYVVYCVEFDVVVC